MTRARLAHRTMCHYVLPWALCPIRLLKECGITDSATGTENFPPEAQVFLSISVALALPLRAPHERPETTHAQLVEEKEGEGEWKIF